mgnify:FL=1
MVKKNIVTFDLPDDPEPLLKALRDDIAILAQAVKEIASKEIPIPKDNSPQFAALNKEISRIKANIKVTIDRLDSKIDDVRNKPVPVDLSGELKEVGEQLDDLKTAVHMLEVKPDNTESLKKDIKDVKASIEDIHNKLTRVTDVVNVLG